MKPVRNYSDEIAHQEWKKKEPIRNFLGKAARCEWKKAAIEREVKILTDNFQLNLLESLIADTYEYKIRKNIKSIEYPISNEDISNLFDDFPEYSVANYGRGGRYPFDHHYATLVFHFLIRYLENKRTSIIESKMKGNKQLSNPEIALFLVIVNHSGLNKIMVDEAETNTTFCKRICKKFNLPYSDKVRQAFYKTQVVAKDKHLPKVKAFIEDYAELNTQERNILLKYLHDLR